MNRLIRVVFLCLAVVLVAFVASFGHYLQLEGISMWRAGSIWATLVLAVVLVVAAWRFSFAANARIFALLLGLLLVEGMLQAVAWMGMLPGVNTKEKLPYARVYWSGEGRGNSIRNRYGWYYPEFDLKAPKRIVMIGDSITEAVEVRRDHTEAADLQRLLRAQPSAWAVLGLGCHGKCPAYYFDVLDYAQRHFPPQEAIVIVYLGNDISDSSPALSQANPYIFYDLDSAGQLSLSPQSVEHRERFIQSMEMCHQPLWGQLAAIVRSHCMILQTVISVRDDIKMARAVRARKVAHPESFELSKLGLDPRPFAADPDPEVRHALDIMLAELAALQQKCVTNHIQLRLVTVPFFPPDFYTTQSGTNWNTHLGEYDFLRSDRAVGTFAKDHDVPFLSLADWMKARGTDVKEIQKLYLSGGCGHFSEQGHALCAQAMYEAFYVKPKP